MSSKFETITLEWDDEKHVIPPNRVMRAISAVEDYVTLAELIEYTQKPGGAKFGKLAMGYAALLQMAGFTVTDEEVYEKMLKMKDEDSSVLFAAIFGLLHLMTPPEKLAKKVTAGDKDGGDATPTSRGKRRPTAAK